jgi:hypothetical protein
MNGRLPANSVEDRLSWSQVTAGRASIRWRLLIFVGQYLSNSRSVEHDFGRRCKTVNLLRIKGFNVGYQPSITVFPPSGGGGVDSNPSEGHRQLWSGSSRTSDRFRAGEGVRDTARTTLPGHRPPGRVAPRLPSAAGAGNAPLRRRTGFVHQGAPRSRHPWPGCPRRSPRTLADLLTAAAQSPLTAWPDTHNVGVGPCDHLHKSATWLLGRHPPLAQLAARNSGVVAIDDNQLCTDIDHPAEVCQP